MKIALLGYGKMGKTIEKIALADGHEIAYKTNEKLAPEQLKKADVAIDFSIAEAAFENITTCFEHQVPVVSGTTGWLEDYEKVLENCKQKNGSFLYASNFSIGVNLFFELNAHLAKMMKNFPEYKPDIDEIHHTQKKDKPSGTAITLAEGVIGNSSKTDWKLIEEGGEKTLPTATVPVKAKRFEDVKGTHKIQYTSSIDAIEIKHTAFSRDGFAKGAIRAAEFIQDKQGVFSMKEVIKKLT